MWLFNIIVALVHAFCTIVYTVVLLSLGITAAAVVLLRTAESDTALAIERIYHRETK